MGLQAIWFAMRLRVCGCLLVWDWRLIDHHFPSFYKNRQILYFANDSEKSFSTSFIDSMLNCFAKKKRNILSAKHTEVFNVAPIPT